MKSKTETHRFLFEVHCRYPWDDAPDADERKARVIEVLEDWKANGSLNDHIRDYTPPVGNPLKAADLTWDKGDKEARLDIFRVCDENLVECSDETIKQCWEAMLSRQQ